jgi:hypothetical protein
MIGNEITGIAVDRTGSYGAIFAAAGILPLLATVLLRRLGGRMEPLAGR